MGEFNELLLKGVFIISVIAFFIAYAQRNRIQELERLVKKLLAESIKREIDEKKNNEVKPIIKTENTSTEITDWSKGQIRDVENAFPDLKTTVPFQKQTPPAIEKKTEEATTPIFIPAKAASPPIAAEQQNKSRTNAEWEALIGGKILNRVGALAIIIGIGFFLKYAFNNNLISESMRVAIGFAAGGLMLAGGYIFKRKNFQVFAQGIAGAGIAILYLSAYSSFNYYHLVPQSVAMVLMILITAITFWQAFENDSIVIALFGWLGGFLTPILISTGQANEVGLFSYIFLLNIGLLVIVLKNEKWAIIEPLSLAATVFYYFAWSFQNYTSDKFSITAIFLTMFWFEFIALELFRIYKKERKITELHQLVSIANSIFFYCALYILIEPLYHEWMGVITLIVAAVYVSVFLLIKSRRGEENFLQFRYLLSAILLSVLASAIQFNDFKISIAWAIESLLLAATAARYKNEIILWSAMVLLFMAFMRFIGVNGAFYISPSVFQFIVNQRALTLSVLLFSSVGSLFLVRKFEHEKSTIIKSFFSYSSISILFLLISLETKDLFFQLSFRSTAPWNSFFNNNLLFVLAIEWLLLLIPLFYFGEKKKNETLIYSSFILLTLTVLVGGGMAMFSLQPFELFVPVINLRAGALLFSATSLFLIARTMEKNIVYPWFNEAANVMRIVMVALIFILITIEPYDFFEAKIAFSIITQHTQYLLSNYHNKAQLFISGSWLAYSLLLMGIGIYRSRFNIRIVAIVIFAITTCKVFFFDLSHLDTLHRIFSFIGLGVILLLVSFLYQKYKHLILPNAEAKKQDV